MGLLQAPGKISPTIKFVRWSFLIWGIVYGFNKRAVLEGLEKKERILRREAIERRHKIEKENTERTYRELIIFFGEMFGVDFPPTWQPPQ